jgi:hypothetical protein
MFMQYGVYSVAHSILAEKFRSGPECRRLRIVLLVSSRSRCQENAAGDQQNTDGLVPREPFTEERHSQYAAENW